MVCLHRRENIPCLSVSPAMVIWKDRKISIEILPPGNLMLMYEQGFSGVYTGKKTLPICHNCQQQQFVKLGKFLLKWYCQAILGLCVNKA